MDIVDTRFGKRIAERRLGKAGPPRVRHGPDVDHALDARLLQRRKELADRRPLISDGEDAHGYSGRWQTASMFAPSGSYTKAA
jgi:hypothetical protein